MVNKRETKPAPEQQQQICQPFRTISVRNDEDVKHINKINKINEKFCSAAAEIKEQNKR